LAEQTFADTFEVAMTRSARLTVPRSAMVLAAGNGIRMRPLTERMPKPLIAVGGKPLLDNVLDRLAATGVETAVVNVHYLADQIERHLASRRAPRIIISDERPELLDTGGGVVKALPSLGMAPFYHLNSDTIWIDGVKSNLVRLAESFDAAKMDALLLLAATSNSVGYSGRGDFSMTADGRLQRRPEREVAPFVYAGVAILSPSFFADTPSGAFSLNLLFDRAIEAGRLHGLRLEGVWMHVGTPDAIAAAEAAILASAA
jgi:MurNAc alpha-1-phosphate uridylyltransferase